MEARCGGGGWYCDIFSCELNNSFVASQFVLIFVLMNQCLSFVAVVACVKMWGECVARNFARREGSRKPCPRALNRDRHVVDIAIETSHFNFSSTIERTQYLYPRRYCRQCSLRAHLRGARRWTSFVRLAL